MASNSDCGVLYIATGARHLAETLASARSVRRHMPELPMVLHTVCFWGIGLSGGYWLSFHAPWRAGTPSVAGFWEGCVVATVAATLLFGALLRRVSRDRL